MAIKIAVPSLTLTLNPGTAALAPGTVMQDLMGEQVAVDAEVVTADLAGVAAGLAEALDLGQRGRGRWGSRLRLRLSLDVDGDFALALVLVSVPAPVLLRG